MRLADIGVLHSLFATAALVVATGCETRSAFVASGSHPLTVLAAPQQRASVRRVELRRRVEGAVRVVGVVDDGPAVARLVAAFAASYPESWPEELPAGTGQVDTFVTLVGAEGRELDRFAVWAEKGWGITSDGYYVALPPEMFAMLASPETPTVTRKAPRS